MFRYLFPLRRLLATTFLVVFVNVFLGQCWCATVNPTPRASQAPAKAVAIEVPAKPAHPGCHGHGPAVTKTKHQGPTDHAPKPAGKSDCCKDKSASLLSSLTTPAEKQLIAPAPALLPPAVDFYFRPAACQWDRTAAVVLVLREHLPPKIPDIRIFIQSLTV